MWISTSFGLVMLVPCIYLRPSYFILLIKQQSLLDSRVVSPRIEIIQLSLSLVFGGIQIRDPCLTHSLILKSLSRYHNRGYQSDSVLIIDVMILDKGFLTVQPNQINSTNILFQIEKFLSDLTPKCGLVLPLDLLCQSLVFIYVLHISFF